MALVSYGGGIIQMSGSIAGNTFAHNRYGNYVRARTKPVNPNTARQATIRAAIAFLTDRWSQTLPALARTAWNDYADAVNMQNRLGVTIKLSGFNHYIRSNAIRKQRGDELKDNGPVIFELPNQDPTFAITASAATQQITQTFDDTLDWDNETDGHIYTFQGKPQNAQRNFFAGPWRTLGQVDGATGAPTATPLLNDVVFAIAEGQKQVCYARISRADGRLSNVFRAETFCTA